MTSAPTVEAGLPRRHKRRRVQRSARLQANVLSIFMAAGVSSGALGQCETAAGGSIGALLNGQLYNGPLLAADTIAYQVTVFVPLTGVECGVAISQVRFWPPNDPPNDPSACDSTNGLSLPVPAGAVLDPGEFLRYSGIDSPLSNCALPGEVNCEVVVPSLLYVADGGDAIDGQLGAAACWDGNALPQLESVQVQLPLSLLFFADADIQLLSSVEAVCEGQSMEVTYFYTATTGVGGAALNAISVDDDVCSDPIRGPDAPGDNDDELEFGELWTFSCTTTIRGQTTSNAMLSGMTVQKGLGLNDSATVTIEEEKDREDPEIIKCPPLLILAAGVGGTVPMPDLVPLVGAVDNCTGPESLSVLQQPAPGALIAIGQTTVLFTVTDLAGNSATESTVIVVAGCSADFDGSGDVGPPDLANLLAAWGGSSDPNACVDLPTMLCAADLNDDGIVGAADLASTLALWGACR